MARILIVDDDESDRLLEKTFLDDLGHELLFAKDGEAALRICREEKVDLVVTDLAMPRLNGLRLIRSLREVDPDARIVAVSGVSPEQLPRAEDLGAVATLFKPVRKEAFLEAVQSGLEDDQDTWEDVWGP